MLLLLARLHNAHNHCIQDVLALVGEGVHLTLSRYLLLLNWHRNVVYFDIWIGESSYDLSLLLWLELRCLRIFLLYYPLSWVAQVLECFFEVILWNVSFLFDLGISQLLVLVEKHQYYCLIAVCYENVRFCGNEDRFDLKRTILKQPGNISVLILLLIELFELHGVVFEFGW